MGFSTATPKIIRESIASMDGNIYGKIRRMSDEGISRTTVLMHLHNLKVDQTGTKYKVSFGCKEGSFMVYADLDEEIEFISIPNDPNTEVKLVIYKEIN